MSTRKYKNYFHKKINLKNLNKINLKDNIHMKYVKKAHDVTVMNPKFITYLLHSLHRQSFGFHSLIPFIKGSNIC